ncbi:MAG: YchJ family protein [Opitutaceae bacterium]
MPESHPCPCGATAEYAACCGPYHQGKAKAATAETLMRSRYAAYVQGEVDYLVTTTHPTKRSKDLRSAYQTTADSIQWIQLDVLNTFQGGASDKTGKVEFRATYLQDGQTSVHHEHSRFKRHTGDWHYLDGVITDAPA